MQSYLTHITNQLHLSEELYKNNSIGLLYGNIGIAIYFFHYARYAKNEIYEDYAISLIEDVQNRINSLSSIDYANGLAGIGCGIEYLTHQGFIDVQTNNLLDEIDKIIISSIEFTEHVDPSLFTGICGLARYLLFRIRSRSLLQENIKILTFRSQIIHIVDILERMLLLEKNKTTDVCFLLQKISLLNYYPTKTNKLIKKYWTEEEIKKITSISNTHLQTHTALPQSLEKLLKEKKMGLLDGYAGIGLSIISQLNKTHTTWHKLI